MSDSRKRESAVGADTAVSPVPQWYAEMIDADYWLACCKSRASLLAMMQPPKSKP